MILRDNNVAMRKNDNDFSEEEILLFSKRQGVAYYRGSILASHPAALGSNLDSAKIASLYCLVCEHY